MTTLLIALARLLISVMDCVEYLIIGYIVLGWFVFFGVIKNRDSVFFKIYIFLMTRIEPLLALIRRFIPTVAGFDFSPLIVFFALHLARVLVIQLFSLALRVFNA